jgi:thioredoxin-like negative regulator of GroEL
MSIPMQKYFVNGENVDEILGAVPEHTIRTMVEGILEKFPIDEAGKLKVLLSSWVEQNKKHSERFSKWAEESNNLEANPIYSSALQAAQELRKANEQLSQVLTQLPK